MPYFHCPLYSRSSSTHFFSTSEFTQLMVLLCKVFEMFLETLRDPRQQTLPCPEIASNTSDYLPLEIVWQIWDNSRCAISPWLLVFQRQANPQSPWKIPNTIVLFVALYLRTYGIRTINQIMVITLLLESQCTHLWHFCTGSWSAQKSTSNVNRKDHAPVPHIRVFHECTFKPLLSVA